MMLSHSGKRTHFEALFKQHIKKSLNKNEESEGLRPSLA